MTLTLPLAMAVEYFGAPPRARRRHI